VGQDIAVKAQIKEHAMVKNALEQAGKRASLNWLQYSAETGTGRMVAVPSREDIPVDINEQLIVELYSK
jgi:small subunit ribosomal protein S4